jgi:hypothetical protein
MQNIFLQKKYIWYKRNQTLLALKKIEKKSNYYTKMQYHYVEHLYF